MPRIVVTRVPPDSHDHDAGAFIAAPTGGVTSDGQARAAIDDLRQLLIDLGFMEAS